MLVRACLARGVGLAEATAERDRRRRAWRTSGCPTSAPPRARRPRSPSAGPRAPGCRSSWPLRGPRSRDGDPAGRGLLRAPGPRGRARADRLRARGQRGRRGDRRGRALRALGRRVPQLPRPDAAIGRDVRSRRAAFTCIAATACTGAPTSCAGPRATGPRCCCARSSRRSASRSCGLAAARRRSAICAAGPGRLAAAFGITGDLNGTRSGRDAGAGELRVLPRREHSGIAVARGPRIGITPRRRPGVAVHARRVAVGLRSSGRRPDRPTRGSPHERTRTQRPGPRARRGAGRADASTASRASTRSAHKLDLGRPCGSSSGSIRPRRTSTWVTAWCSASCASSRMPATSRCW